MNTTRAEYADHGMNHMEGGWPKDINLQDSEQTVRYKKKIEKDEAYIHTILHLSQVGGKVPYIILLRIGKLEFTGSR